MSVDTPQVPGPRPAPEAATVGAVLPSRADIERVLAGEGQSLVAQPVVDVAGVRTAGWEMLSRFTGPWSPDLWFRAARDHGLDGALTVATLDLVADLAPGRPPGTFLTVNVEPHLLTRPPVRDRLLTGDRLDGWVVELTEHVGTEEDPALPDVLAALRAQGALVAMDDAGTGWSGLSQMLHVRPDVVKLDRSLVNGLDQDPVRRALVRLLGDVAGRMDGWLLAEGVETRAELAELVGLEVPLVQGWALARPGTGWPEPQEPVMGFLDQHVSRATLREHVLGLVRPATVHLGDPATAIDGDVVAGADERPSHVVVADPAGGRHLVPALLVAPSTPPAEVLQRAMARTAAWRHAPVVCTDPRGRVLGTISVAALVDHVVNRGGTVPS